MRVWDAIVLGAGPAGIAAATRLASGGASVVIIDENPSPGGQIWRSVETASAQRLALLGPDYCAGRERVAALRASRATLLLNTTLWRAEPEGIVWLKTPAGIERHQSAHLVLAVGAIERPVPRPGWTLPGITTIGGLQILLKRNGLLPAGPLLLVGTGPLFYLYALQCLSAGKRDITLLDTAQRRNWLRAAVTLPRALCGEGGRYLYKGVGLLAALRLRRVAFYSGVGDIVIDQDARQDEHVLRCVSGGKTRTFRAQHIALHEGVIPDQHVARTLGCEFLWHAAANSFTPRRNARLESSVAGVFIAGDAGGIGGYAVAEAEGQLVASVILHRLGKLETTAMQRECRQAERQRQRHLAARPLLDCLYTPSPEVLTPHDNTIVCRCEEVTCGAVREAVRQGACGPNQVKAFLRTGMGPCQGRLCAPTVARLIAAQRHITPALAGYYPIRSPLTPISVGELAALDAPEGSPDA